MLQYVHDFLGHKGFYPVLFFLVLRMWWPGIQNDTRWFLRTCHPCQLRSTMKIQIPPVVPMLPSLFMKVHIDIMFLQPDHGYKMLIHARCVLTGYPEAKALRR
ncbi:hypothetical protein DL96DRAFT_1423280, partial [Flagelloscypha sp. PMI_526]